MSLPREDYLIAKVVRSSSYSEMLQFPARLLPSAAIDGWSLNSSSALAISSYVCFHDRAARVGSEKEAVTVTCVRVPTTTATGLNRAMPMICAAWRRSANAPMRSKGRQIVILAFSGFGIAQRRGNANGLTLARAPTSAV